MVPPGRVGEEGGEGRDEVLTGAWKDGCLEGGEGLYEDPEGKGGYSLSQGIQVERWPWTHSRVGMDSEKRSGLRSLPTLL